MKILKYIAASFLIVFLVISSVYLERFLFFYEIPSLLLSTIRLVLIFCLSVPLLIGIGLFCIKVLYKRYINIKEKASYPFWTALVLFFLFNTIGIGNFFFSNYYGVDVEERYETKTGDEIFIPQLLFSKSNSKKDIERIIISEYNLQNDGVNLVLKKRFIFSQAGYFEGYKFSHKKYEFSSIFFFGILEKSIFVAIYFLIPLLILLLNNHNSFRKITKIDIKD